jgi:hypothetical protein
MSLLSYVESKIVRAVKETLNTYLIQPCPCSLRS